MHREEVGEATAEHIPRFYSDAAVEDDEMAVARHCVNNASNGSLLMRGRNSIRQAELKTPLLVVEGGIDLSETRPPTNVHLRVIPTPSQPSPCVAHAVGMAALSRK